MSKDRDLEAEVADLVREVRRGAGMTQRDLAQAARTSQSAIARYESAQVLPDLRTVARLVRACGRSLHLEVVDDGPAQSRGRTGMEGAVRRPVAVPDQLDNPTIEKATGVVELPRRVRWSGPRRTYDLSKRRDRVRVYEQVLREGTEEDVQRFVRCEDLVDLWHELVLPRYVREAWEPRIARLRKAS